MKRIYLTFCLLVLAGINIMASAQETVMEAEEMMADAGMDNLGVYQVLKEKFIEGNPYFMSLVALVLILGLALCTERVVFLTLSEIDYRRFLNDVKVRLTAGDKDGALKLAQETNGPVAKVSAAALARIDQPVQDVEHAMETQADIELARLEKGSAWIKLFIAIAPSLGFLGTVFGMIMAFDQIETEGDIGPTTVAGGMRVALITTIFGIIVAVTLQLFYSYIITRIERLTSHIEDASMTLLDEIKKVKNA